MKDKVKMKKDDLLTCWLILQVKSVAHMGKANVFFTALGYVPIVQFCVIFGVIMQQRIALITKILYFWTFSFLIIFEPLGTLLDVSFLFQGDWSAQRQQIRQKNTTACARAVSISLCSSDGSTLLSHENLVPCKWVDFARRCYNLQGSSYLLGQRLRACFILKFALQSGEGEKREGMPISKQSAQNIWPKKYIEPWIDY